MKTTPLKKEIEVIRYDTDHSAIIGDVNDGDKVVIKGQNLLSDGDLIQIVEDSMKLVDLSVKRPVEFIVLVFGAIVLGAIP
ncbi:hypothetical protein KHA80_11900 [Anaerobacillus sp. HL2]|nr:hypothetical protein KHA80_11900 [Anaerobacillus sp. HL2]